MTGQYLKRAPYRPLSTDAAEIRVLELLPNTAGVACRLHHNLISEARYEALSYTWTESTDRDPVIIIDGQPIKIRKSLADALTRLRKSNASRMLWVDAICIDQEDVHEKSRQVQLMRDIYAASQKTLIWLGPADDTTAEGFKLAEQRAKAILHKAVHDDNEIPKTVGVFWTGFFENKQWYALSNLYTRKWFRRAWIVQEVSLAARATVFCG